MPEQVQIAVIGAGPAGIAAAVSAAEHGADVLLIDEQPRAGGQIWRHTEAVPPPAGARPWLDRLQQSSARTCFGAAVVDMAADGRLLLERGEQASVVQAQRVVLATGARELFLPFPGWTLPGVAGVGGVQALLKSGLDVRGRRVVVAGSGPLLLPVAGALVRAGADVRAVLEQTPLARLLAFGAGLWRTPARLLEAGRYRRAFRRIPFHAGRWVTAAHGGAHVTHATVSDGYRSYDVECDLLCVGYGLVPSLELALLIDCAMGDVGVRVDPLQRTSVAHVYAAGEPTGIAGADAATVQGRIAGLHAAGARVPAQLQARAHRTKRFRAALARAFAPRPELAACATPDTIVCRCEDVTAGEVAGCRGAREAKLLTRAGMGACQARVCGPALQHLFDWDAAVVRAPVLPARVSTLMEREN